MKNALKITLLAALLAGSGAALASCGEAKSFVDELKLDADYKNADGSFKDFINDGVGKVTLKTGIDGDTAHFYSLDGSTIIKARFNGIDTPESTGQLQPWGKAASKFTTGKLESAKTIVISSEDNTKAAVKDSTGTRYLSFVWVSEKEDAKLEDLKLLNLWIVQEGFSAAKGISESKYQEIFTSADLEAQKKKLHIWSKDPDPDYNYADPVECDLQLIGERKIKKQGETEYTEFDWEDQKVTIQGIVAAVRGTDCWIEYTYNNELSGGVEKTYGMYIFTMYKSYVPLLKTGNLVQVTGTITSYMGNYQMVDVYWSMTSRDPECIKLISKDNPIPEVNVDAKDISKNSKDGVKYLNCVVNIKDLLVGTGAKVTETSSGFTILVYLTDMVTKSLDLALYVQDQTFMKDDEGQRITTREGVKKYLCDETRPFYVNGPITIFTAEDESYTNYDICYLSSSTITFAE